MGELFYKLRNINRAGITYDECKELLKETKEAGIKIGNYTLTVIIKNTAEITLDELYELKEQGISNIKIFDEKSDNEPDNYWISDLILIKEKIQEYIKNIPEVSDDDPDKEKKIFTYIYEKMAYNITYDDYAADCVGLTGYERDMTEEMVNRASGLYGGLIDNKAICAGYSEILRNILSEVGINAEYRSGHGEKGGHAWNQVQLDGIWYNCDITNDADFILEGLKVPHFLKSNMNFTRYEKYPIVKEEKVRECNVDISDEQQEILIEEQRTRILEEERDKNIEKEPKKGFISRIVSFFEKSNLKLKEMKGIEMNRAVKAAKER